MKIYIKSFVVLLCSLCILSCEDDQKYDGPLRTKFGGTSATYYVENASNSTFDISVQLIGAAQNHDITVNTKADASSTALAGVDYTMPATVTIPAGSNIATLTINGLYAGVSTVVGSKTLVINLESPAEAKVVPKQDVYRVLMTRYCTWVKSDFVGTWSVNEYSLRFDSEYDYLVKISEGNGDTLIVSGLWDNDSYPGVKVVPNEPSNATYTFKMETQYWFNTSATQEIWIQQTDLKGTFSPCDMTIGLNYMVIPPSGSGHYDNLETKWTKVSSSTSSLPTTLKTNISKEFNLLK